MNSGWALPALVDLSGGAFLMGSGRGREDETPVHEVDLSPFTIGRYAVTNREYAYFVTAAQHPAPPRWRQSGFDDPLHPVVCVNWYDAAAYCSWLSLATGRKFRLPTEAEREYACRGGATTEYPWGDDPAGDGENGGMRWDHGPDVVGGAPNAFGLCNVADNVHEWCSDWYGRDYYRTSPRRNPAGPGSGARKVSRGGSWRHKVKVTRSAARSALDPSFRYADFGFRVACDAP